MMMQTPYFQQEHTAHTAERYQREATIERALRALRAVRHEPRRRAARRGPLFRLVLTPRT
jgi:hypothetical protein